MSKLLLSLLALFVLVSCGDKTDDPTPQPDNAPSTLALSYNGKVLPAGSIIDIPASERDDELVAGAFEVIAGDDNKEYPSPSPVVVSTSPLKKALSFKVDVMTLEHERFTWCGINKLCMPMTQNKEMRWGQLTPSAPSAPLLLECNFMPRQYSHEVATVLLTAQGEHNSAVYTLRFVYEKK